MSSPPTSRRRQPQPFLTWTSERAGPDLRRQAATSNVGTERRCLVRLFQTPKRDEMVHLWELKGREGKGSFESKIYLCKTCGAGPVRILATAGKANITKTAKAQGIDSDCKTQLVKEIHDK